MRDQILPATMAPDGDRRTCQASSGEMNTRASDAARAGITQPKTSRACHGVSRPCCTGRISSEALTTGRLWGGHMRKKFPNRSYIKKPTVFMTFTNPSGARSYAPQISAQMRSLCVEAFLLTSTSKVVGQQKTSTRVFSRQSEFTTKLTHIHICQVSFIRIITGP